MTATIAACIAVLALCVVAWLIRRPTPVVEPQAEVWVRRTTTVEEFHSTGAGHHAAPFVFDPQYQTLRPPVPMLENR